MWRAWLASRSSGQTTSAGGVWAKAFGGAPIVDSWSLQRMQERRRTGQSDSPPRPSEPATNDGLCVSEISRVQILRLACCLPGVRAGER
jgi:hypothetical protein